MEPRKGPKRPSHPLDRPTRPSAPVHDEGRISLELPLYQPSPRRRVEADEEHERGVWIVELGGD